MRFFLVLCFLCFSAIVLADTRSKRGIDFSVCARMNIPILKEIAEKACVAACLVQNCGTGVCQKREGRPVCICRRCANGGELPLPSKG